MVNMLGGPIGPNGCSNWPFRTGRRHRARRNAADAGPPAFAMRDQDGLRQTGLDRRRGMAHMDHERAPADGRAVHPGGRNAEIVRDLHRRLAGGGDAVDVLRPQPGIRHRVQRRVGVQLDLRHVGDDTEFRGLGGADNGYGLASHGDYPFAGRNSGSVTVSFCFSNITSSGMSSCNASGVCGQSTMLVIMRGPSASCTTAMA